MRKNPTKLELYVKELLDKAEIPYKSQKVVCQRHIVDFWFPGNYVLEVDGPYHDREPWKSYDTERQRFLERKGYKVKRIHWSKINKLQPGDYMPSDNGAKVQRNVEQTLNVQSQV